MHLPATHLIPLDCSETSLIDFHHFQLLPLQSIYLLCLSLSRLHEPNFLLQTFQPPAQRCLLSDLQRAESVQLDRLGLQGGRRLDDLCTQRFGARMVSAQMQGEFLLEGIAG